MAYSSSTRTLRKIEPRLTALARGAATSWRTDTPLDAQRFAYKVREALYIAMKNAAEFPALARAHSLYIIQVNGNIVQALPKGTVAVEQRAELSLTPANYAPSSPVDQSLTCVGPASVAEIVQFWLDAQPTNATIQVTEAILTNGELNELAQWARGLTPAWEMVHVSGESNFIIKPSPKRSFTGAASPIHAARVGDTPNLYEK